MKKRIEENLRKATEHMVREDAYARIAERISAARGERTNVMSINEVYANRKNKVLTKIAVGIAACLVLILGLFGGNYYSENLKVDSIVNIDVNPSIELTASKSEKVLNVTPLNSDAEKVLGDMELRNVSVDVAVNAIVGSMVKNGYLNDGRGEILVTVQNKNTKRAESLQQNIKTDIENTLKTNNASAEIINQTLSSADGGASQLSEKHNISLGKAAFILNLTKKDSSLNADELAVLSLKEIADIVSQKNIDISDIVDYDSDDSIFENIEDSVEDADEEIEDTKKAESSGAKVSLEKAKSIAFTHAGVNEKNVTDLKAEYDGDGKTPYYEIDFTSGGYEYEYEINAETGAVIKSQNEPDDDFIPAVSSKANSSKSATSSKAATSSKTEASSKTSDIISQDAAKSIALSHSGLGSSAIVKKCELDYEDGIRVYEVEIESGKTEYSCEINAKTGEIIDSETDTDD